MLLRNWQHPRGIVLLLLQHLYGLLVLQKVLQVCAPVGDPIN